MMVRPLSLLIASVIAGYGLTLFCYMIGGVLVQPSLFLAKLLFDDRGGDSLILPFGIINTVICSILIYAILWRLTKSHSS